VLFATPGQKLSPPEAADQEEIPAQERQFSPCPGQQAACRRSNQPRGDLSSRTPPIWRQRAWPASVSPTRASSPAGHDRSRWAELPGGCIDARVGSAGLQPVFFLDGPCPTVPAC